MLGVRMGMGVAVLGCVFCVGCSNNSGELESLREQNQQLQARLVEADSKLKAAPDAAQLQALQNEIVQRESRIRELEGQLQKGEGGVGSDPELKGIKATYDRRKGELTVNVPGDVLFAAGSASLKPESKATLNKIVRAIKQDYPGKLVRVEGHTDTDPIRASGRQWIDNLDLSLNRAAAVTRYLESQGIPKKQISTVGHGENSPKGTKAASRRVEIIVVVG